MSDPQGGPFSDMHDEFRPRKLVVIATLREAYQGAWTHLGEMVRLIWLPGVLYLALSVVGALLPYETNIFLRLAIELASMFLWAIISVAWYRFILIGESPSGSYQINFGRREGRYMLVFLLLLTLSLPIFITPAFSISDTGRTSAGSLVAFFALLLSMVCIYFLFRMLLLLPAVAIDEPINVRMVLERTRGNFWRILLVCVLSSLPFLALFIFIAALGDAIGLPNAVTLTLSSLFSIFFAIVNVAVLAICYRELIGPPGSMAADMDRLDTA
jgi:hypothetical protein